MDRRKFLKVSAAGIALSSGALAAQKNPAKIVVSKRSSCIESLQIDGQQIQFVSTTGGFSVYDAVNKKDIDLAEGSVEQSGEKTVFHCEKKGDISLIAEFVDEEKYILVRGQVKNLQSGERGILLNYCIPFAGKELVFGNELNNSVKVGDSEQEGNFYPIAVMCSSDTGLAMAIPPSEPREFGMIGSSKGLTTRFYLGLTSETAHFPNRATFVFIIYPVDPTWGFRSAISKYYEFHPDYYRVRTTIDGLKMINVFGQELPDMEHYGINRIGLDSETVKQDFERDKVKYRLMDFSTINVGTKEISKLPQPPSSEEEATKIYKEHRTSILEKGAAGGPEQIVCELIDSSTCETPTGQYVLSIRFTGWGGNSISFTTNPNPDLFNGRRQNVGSSTLKKIGDWLAKYPLLDGILVDSLGANFPAHLNYRREHFQYARYPLTCDPSGRAALHNQISHYEFLEDLRKQLREKNKFLFANGIYIYPSKGGEAVEEQWGGDFPEHYRGKGVMLGRFFLASLLDISTSEAGWRSTQGRYEFYRVSMGKKLYVPVNSVWEDAKQVEQYFNKCIVYTLFASNVRLYSMDVTKIKQYYPDYYERDKALYDWFMPKVRLLSRAGWEPVTYARANGEKVLLERYGSGDTVYFALMSEYDSEQKCMVTIDLESLGFNAGDYPLRFLIDEIAQSAPVEYRAPGTIELSLKPFKTCIIAVRKTG